MRDDGAGCALAPQPHSHRSAPAASASVRCADASSSITADARGVGYPLGTRPGLLRRDHHSRERTGIMKRYTTLIAEDEPLASEGLAAWVRELPELELIGIRADGPSTLHALRELEPQLVLMDIQMPGMSGLQVLRALAGEPERIEPAVIFTTAYDEHAVAAFELHAVDYLLKPFSQERFIEAVRHALQTVGAPGARAAGARRGRARPGRAA